MFTLFKRFTLLLSLVSILSQSVFAATYALPTAGDNIIGELTATAALSNDSLLNIALRNDLGLNAITGANGELNPVGLLPVGMKIILPTQHILPPFAAKGIIINLPEMRMYYYPADSQGIVMTYPIGIGRVGKTIPIKKTVVVRKAKNPTWTPPADIRRYNEEKGVTLPYSIPAGPDNPLGPYAVYLQIPTYLIHSTIYPDSVGRRASFGCIRMHEEDIEDFFPLLKAGVPVTIINYPTKVGWLGSKLYLEAHKPLEEHSHELFATQNGVIELIQKAIGKKDVIIDWQMVTDIANNRDGLPHEVGMIIQ